MTAPVGLGMWIAYWNQADRGDIRSVIPRCHRSGIKWLAIRCNSGAERSNFKFIAQELKKEDIQVFSWKYTVPGNADVQASIVHECLEDGADGHIINPEVEWEHAEGTADQAHELCGKIRALVGAAYVAYAPMDCPSYHSSFPYSAFNTHCDAAMPQTYWSEHDDKGASATLARAENQWAGLKVQPKDYLPIGVTYGRGTPFASHERSTNMGAFRMTDLGDFLQRYPGKATSLYSYEAAFQTCWDLLERYENAAQIAGTGVLGRLKGM